MSQEEFEKIESYLTGQMSEEQLSDFKLEIENNPDLKEKVEDLKTQILAVEEVSLREKLDSIHKDMSKISGSEKKSTKIVSFNRFFAIAASVAFLVALGYMFLGNNDQHDKLYAEFFKPDPGLVTPMSSSENYEFYRGMVDYKRGEYELAINRWQEQLKMKPDNDSLNYFIGMTLMAQNKLEKAKPFLQSVAAQTSSVFKPEVHYFIGLIALNDGDLNKAKEEILLSGYENSTKLINRINDM